VDLVSSAPSARQRTLPAPLCKPFPHFLRWTRNTVQTLIMAGLFAYIGMLIIVALYYILFETTPTMNAWWHSTVPNSDIRHTIRNVGEGLLGGLLAQQIVWNHYKPKVQKRLLGKKSLLDRIEIALHIPNVKDNKPFSVWQLLVTPFLVVLYAIPGGVLGFLIVHWFHRHNLHSVAGLVTSGHTLSPHAQGIAAKMQQTFTQAWPTKLVGYFAAFVFGRRPAKGVFDDVQLLFVERRATMHAKPYWFSTPAFKARYNDTVAQFKPYQVHSTLMRWLVLGSLPVALALAAYGYYILGWIAN
jgi:hypothetical protein